jgi:hypothetical protein
MNQQLSRVERVPVLVQVVVVLNVTKTPCTYTTVETEYGSKTHNVLVQVPYNVLVVFVSTRYKYLSSLPTVLVQRVQVLVSSKIDKNLLRHEVLRTSTWSTSHVAVLVQVP